MDKSNLPAAETQFQFSAGIEQTQGVKVLVIIANQK